MIDVLFLVLPETLLLDLVGPAEAFRLANQQLEPRAVGRRRFALRYVSAQPEAHDVHRPAAREPVWSRCRTRCRPARGSCCWGGPG